MHILNGRRVSNCVSVHRLTACLQLGTTSYHILSEVHDSYLAAPEVGEGRREGGREAEGERMNETAPKCKGIFLPARSSSAGSTNTPCSRRGGCSRPARRLTWAEVGMLALLAIPPPPPPRPCSPGHTCGRHITIEQRMEWRSKEMPYPYKD